MILNVINLCKSFGTRKALCDFSSEIRPGIVTGLLGPNGAGKTTLIRIILGIIKPDSGSVEFSGKSSVYKGLLGYVPEENALYGKSKVLDNLLYYASLKNLDKADAKKEAKNLLEMLGAYEYSDKYVETLSKGNKQKVQIAASLIHNPEIIIWDEPFSGLDPIAREVVIDLMRDRAKSGKIFIVSTHQLDSAEKFCDSFLLLNQGKLLLEANLAEAKSEFTGNTLEIETNAPVTYITSLPGVQGAVRENSKLIVSFNNQFDKKEFISKINTQYDIFTLSHHTATIKDIFFKMVGQL
ncbi:MAG: ABC transporter ATP-binding protein [Melioribacteraceae bacterium]|nr:MAG: ABC transporter ATP-binding protein [Melioribacteraceae bacterium]